TKKRTSPSLKRQTDMQQQSAQRPALADRAITIRPRPPTSQRQFAGILNHHDVAPADPRGRARHRVAHHLLGRHSVMAQKAPKPAPLAPGILQAVEYSSPAAQPEHYGNRHPFF